MQQYLQLIKHILLHGESRIDRTGSDVRATFYGEFEHDLRDGFPLLTTKYINYRSVFRNLVGLLQREPTPYSIDSASTEGVSDILDAERFKILLCGLKSSPYGRLHIMAEEYSPDTAYIPRAQRNALQCYVTDDGYIDIRAYQRYCDVFLAMPTHLASYAALLHLIAQLTGYKPRVLYIAFGDLRICKSHLVQVDTQIFRTPMALPELTVANIKSLDEVTPDSFQIHGYEYHPAIP